MKDCVAAEYFKAIHILTKERNPYSRPWMVDMLIMFLAISELFFCLVTVLREFIIVDR